MPIHFTVGESDSVCTSALDVRLEPLADGGARIGWTLTQRTNDQSGCHLVAPATSGNASVSGPCCATTVDIPVPSERKTFRLTVQTDWQR